MITQGYLSFACGCVVFNAALSAALALLPYVVAGNGGDNWDGWESVGPQYYL